MATVIAEINGVIEILSFQREAFPKSCAEGCIGWWLHKWAKIQATVWSQIPETPVQITQLLSASVSLSIEQEK